MEIQSHARHTKRLSILTAVVSAIITFVLLLAYQFVSGRQQIMEDLRTEAKIIGANSAAALVFNDQKAAVEILSAIRLTPRIVGGALYHADGRLFVSENDRLGVFPGTVEMFHPANLNDVDAGLGFFAKLMREEVYLDDSHVGTLLIHVTYASLFRRLFEYAVGAFVIGAIALFLAYRFTVGLRKQVALTEWQLQKLALYDQVTQLPNRSFLSLSSEKR